MKLIKSNIILSVSIVFSAILSGCVGSSGSSESLLFGKVPSIVEKYQEENNRFKEALKRCDSKSEAEKIFTDAEALESETLSKVEEAGQAWSGTTLDILSNDSLTIKTPLTVTYDGFFSKMSFQVKYQLTGEIVVAKDLVMPARQGSVYIVGLDADGNEIVRNKIGMVSSVDDLDGNGNVKVPAGRIVSFEPLTFRDSKAAEYPKIKSLKIAI